MKLSLDWLSEFIDFTESDPKKIADKLTVSTAEVESVETQGANLDGCCVGKVTSLSKHPNADKLSLCDVETDKGTKRVVCGGTNLREGMCVAFAHVGTEVLTEEGELFKLEKIKIRGEESAGMICAAEELDLTSQYPPKPEDGKRPVIDLGDGVDDVKKSLSEFIGSGGDTVLDIDNHSITHRPDLFSQFGFARECTALGLARWKKDRPMFKDQKFPTTTLPFKNVLDCKKEIPQYFACLMSIDSIGETPDWMKKRLESVGIRSIYLPIDITNYVMIELGMPLHSFDADDLKGNIHMRLSKKGEKIVTLDKSERELPEGAIVLSDDEGIFDLLGVMGGLRSSTKEGTKNIYLHSAGVDPMNIRRTIVATGHRTDAATIYEKGVPNIIVRLGFNRALELFLELVPGAKVISAMDSWGDDGKPKSIEIPIKRISEFLGAEIPEKKSEKILKDLEFTVEKKGDSFIVTPPLHRLGDISNQYDLIEEIGRIFGFDAIEAKLPSAPIDPPERDQRVHVLRDSMKEFGFYEVLPLSLVGPALLEKAKFSPKGCTEIENPIGEETSIMQPSIMPGLLEHAENNILNIEKSLKTFNWGQVFEEGPSSAKATADKKKENIEFGALIASRVETGIENDPFLELKSAIKNSVQSVGYSIGLKVSKNAPAHAHPGRFAEICVCKKTVGTLFEVHPNVCNNFDLPHRAAALTLNLSQLFDLEPEDCIAASVPEFPAITYDLTIPFSQDKQAGDLVEKIKKASDLLESVEVAKLFAPEGMQKYNLTLRCTYRAADRTLKEEEAKEAHKAVLALVG
ncbi:phenylalanine--tRNA ligase subunit beta [Patescibacteria group bacterium]|nr:phenylalanine--tRNA ligase subunit beta [Patescibacteria group bacterium]